MWCLGVNPSVGSSIWDGCFFDPTLLPAKKSSKCFVNFKIYNNGNANYFRNRYSSNSIRKTKRTGQKITVSVKDNSIQKKVVDKIFQICFSTKAPGLGTRLGLNLRYEIVKAGDSEIRVETQEWKASGFIIQSPALKK